MRSAQYLALQSFIFKGYNSDIMYSILYFVHIVHAYIF